MLRVAWWVVVSWAVNAAVWAAWPALGLPAPGEILYTLITYCVLYAVVAAYARHHLGDPWEDLVPLRGIALWLALPVALLTLGTFLLSFQSISLFEAINVLPPEVFDLVSRGLPDTQASDPSLLTELVSTAVLPAVFEEATFRGLVLQALAATMTKRRAIVISAIYFAAVHFRIQHTADTFLLGLLYGWMFVRTGSLLPSMLAHFLHNGVCTLLDQLDLWPGSADAWVGVNAYGLMPAWTVWAGMGLIVAGVVGIRMTWSRQGGGPAGTLDEFDLAA